MLVVLVFVDEQNVDLTFRRFQVNLELFEKQVNKNRALDWSGRDARKRQMKNCKALKINRKIKLNQFE